MNVLVVAAHPDDEVLGPGGTVALHADRGDEVHLALLCEGVSRRYEAERHSVVEQQARRSASLLGAASLHVGALQDQALDTLPLSDVAREVEILISQVRPDIVYTHYIGDINRDHQIVSEAVMVATRPYAAPEVRFVLMYETPSSTEWAPVGGSARFEPTVFVDVSTTLDRKCSAFECYEAEVRPYPHPRSPAALRNRAGYWGSISGFGAAEPFVLVRARVP